MKPDALPTSTRPVGLTTTRPRRAPQRHRQGFSLVELLTASALAGVVFIVLLGLLDGSLRLWQSGSGHLQAYGEARYALNRAADDISAAVIREGTGELQQADPQPPLPGAGGGQVVQDVIGQPLPQPGKSALVQNHPALEGMPGVVFVQRRRNPGAGDLVLTAYRHHPDLLLLQRAEIDSTTVWDNNRDYASGDLGTLDWDWRPLCTGVTGFDLRFFTANDVLEGGEQPDASQPVWDSRQHGRPAQGRLRLDVVDTATLTQLLELGPESPRGQQLIEDKTITLSRDLRF